MSQCWILNLAHTIFGMMKCESNCMPDVNKCVSVCLQIVSGWVFVRACVCVCGWVAILCYQSMRDQFNNLKFIRTSIIRFLSIERLSIAKLHKIFNVARKRAMSIVFQQHFQEITANIRNTIINLCHIAFYSGKCVNMHSLIVAIEIASFNLLVWIMWWY